MAVGTPARRTDEDRPPLLGPLLIGGLAIIGALAVLRIVVGALTGLLFLAVLVVCGRREPGFDPGVPVVSLVERCGEHRSWHDTLACLREVAGEELGRFSAAARP